MVRIVTVLISTLAAAVLLGGGCGTKAPSADAGASALAPQQAYVQREPSEGGIGKMYLGREVAEVMGHRRAAWMERPERERTELPARLVRALDLRPSDVVADIGAGTGYFTFRIAPEVPRGLVYAVDIQQAMVDTLGARVHRREVENVRPLQGTILDPRLPNGSIDLVLIVDAYHEFSHPHEMMTALYEDLKPGGRLAIVEYRGEDPTVPVEPLHKMSADQIQREMEVHGFQWRETLDVLPQQHLMIFERPVG